MSEETIKCLYGSKSCHIVIAEDGFKLVTSSSDVESFKWTNILWIEVPSIASDSSSTILPPTTLPTTQVSGSSSSASISISKSFSYTQEQIDSISKEGYVVAHMGVVRKDSLFGSIFSSSSESFEAGDNFRIHKLKLQQQKAKDFIELVRSRTCFHPSTEIQSRPRVLILINPFGGKKLAPKIFNQILPIFKWAKVDYEVIKTTHVGHAEEIGETCDLDKYDVLATVSGDGLFHELLNGLMKRKDAEKAREMPLAIIPGGSGNALAQSLGLIDPNLAALAVVRGARRKMDLMAVTDSEKTRYCFLSVSYAFTADCDMESEEYRWAGVARFTMAAVVRLLSLRRYSGTAKFLPAEKTEEIQKEVNAIKEKEPESTLFHSKFEFDQVPEYWETIDGDLTLFQVQNLPYISSDILTGPFASMEDGLIDLVYSQTPDRTDMISTFLSDLEDPKSFATDPIIKHRKAKAVYFIPKSDLGNLVLDGERHKITPVKIEALPKAITIVCPESVQHPLYKPKK